MTSRTMRHATYTFTAMSGHLRAPVSTRRPALNPTSAIHRHSTASSLLAANDATSRVLCSRHVMLGFHVFVWGRALRAVTATTRIHRWRLVEWPLHIEVSCEISRDISQCCIISNNYSRRRKSRGRVYNFYRRLSVCLFIHTSSYGIIKLDVEMFHHESWRLTYFEIERSKTVPVLVFAVL